MSLGDWKPTASVETLKQRAALLAHIRRFFAARDVIEVDTQILSQAAVSDPFIDTLEAQFQPYAQAPVQPYYMQTSPEYAMKRLLAAGMGSIYQLGKVFRNGEQGRRHNPEFTMLEWYRLGFSWQQLMDEVEQLVRETLNCEPIQRVSYRTLFVTHLGIDPHTAPIELIRDCVREQIDAPFEDERRDTWLELAMSEILEPKLIAPTFVYDFPASQAALAQLRRDESDTAVATRFELYIQGMEIANGYQELTDPEEQRRRFDADLEQRKQLGLPIRPAEMRLVEAFKSGLPECSGVALGFDRLLMLSLGVEQIAEVIPFAFERA